MPLKNKMDVQNECKKMKLSQTSGLLILAPVLFCSQFMILTVNNT